MKNRSPEQIKKSTTRWIVAAVLLLFYSCLMIKFGDLMEFRMQSYHGAPEPMFVYVSALFSQDPADREVEGIDMTKLGDPEEIERNIQNRLGQYQQDIRDLIGSMQKSIDEMKAEMEGTS